MNKAIRVAVVMVMLGLLSGCSNLIEESVYNPDNYEQVVVQGYIVDSFSTPLSYSRIWLRSGASVTAEQFDKSDITTWTDSEGRFSLPDVPEGIYQLYCEDWDGNISVKPYIYVSNTSSTDIGLMVINNWGGIKGTVKIEDRTDYSGIEVRLLGTHLVTYTNRFGDFNFSRVKASWHKLGISVGGYHLTEPKKKKFKVLPTKTHEVGTLQFMAD